MPVVTIRPMATGDRKECIPYPSDLVNWDCVNDVTPDEDTTYVASGSFHDPTTCIYYGGPFRDLYHLEDITLPAGSVINFVRITVRVRNIYADVGAIRTLIKTYGVEYESDDYVPPTAYTNFSLTYEKNPFSKAAWTVSEVNALQAGVVLISAEDPILGRVRTNRCTQVFVDVDYTPPPPPVAVRVLGDGLTWIVS